MIIKTLIENTAISEDFRSEHGLSLYIETKAHKLLFDTGASGLFAENALKMNIDLSEVDMVVLSHGHYDHGGGLHTFLNLNKKAKVYLNRRAFDKHYANRPNGKKEYIGLDESLMPSDRFIFTGDHLVIDEELELFSNVRGARLLPSGNRDLFMGSIQSMVPDDFSHEQNLIIKEDENRILVAGCAHKGIVNILEHMRQLKGRFPTYVIGGFHLSNPAAKVDEDPAVVSQVGAYLINTNAKFYTCHCTGLKSYSDLKSMMKENVDYLSTGSQMIF